jgi:mannosyltransferase OCH1-like enzyme
MIPKIIYQTWFTKDLPISVSKIIDNMMYINPEYKHILFDDSDMDTYISSNFGGKIYEAYRMLRIGAAKADLWRYLILYKDGGIYLDIDSTINGDLNNLISENNKCVITRENNPNKFVQWCLMFESKSDILKICIDKCVDNIINKKQNDILKLTGPDVFSDSIREALNDKEIFFKNDTYLNNKYFEMGVKFYGFDYQGFCKFRHESYSDLYNNKPDWREEQKTKSIFII